MSSSTDSGVNYADLSAHKRDVLCAVIVEVEESAKAIACSREIKQRTADIREEDPSPYTYQLLGDLEESGWIERLDTNSDGRIVDYQITAEGWAAVVDRELLDVSRPVSPTTPEKPRRVTSSD